MSSHISTQQLALYSTGDLGWLKRRRVEAHLDQCSECSRMVAEFTSQQEDLNGLGGQLPAGMTEAMWKSLASEMTANIRLGLAAGECISQRPVFTTRPRLALTLAGLAVVVLVAGLQRPKPELSEPVVTASAPRLLESSKDGVELRSGNRVLRVSTPEDLDVIRTVSTRGEIRSRYVDDSGVTIVNVYAE